MTNVPALVLPFKTLWGRLLISLQVARSLSPTRQQAITSALKAGWRELRRLGKLGLHTYALHADLEIRCFDKGLTFSEASFGPGGRHLGKGSVGDGLQSIDYLLLDGCPTGVLLHPLIAPECLGRSITPQAGVMERHDAIESLLSPRDRPHEYWGSLPAIRPDVAPVAKNRGARVAVCLHLFYPEVWPEIGSLLSNIRQPFDLYVTVPEFACTPVLSEIVRDVPSVSFFPAPNRGRDVLPFLRLLCSGALDSYLAVCKLHTKKSTHMSAGDRWRREAFAGLIGSAAEVDAILARFDAEPDLGIVGPDSLLVAPGHPLYRGKNSRDVAKLLARAGIDNQEIVAPFFAGSMFWFRPLALRRLRQLDLQPSDFPLEMAQQDGTTAHAVERVFNTLVEVEGFRAG